MMSSKKQTLLALSILLLGIIIVLSGCKEKSPAAQDVEGMEDAPPPEVGVIVVETQPVKLTTELPGRVDSLLKANIMPQVNGLIQERFFTEGSYVEAGELLYQIDPAPFQAALDKANANLEVAKKTVERSRAALAASVEKVNQQRATLNFAQKNRQRIETLVEKGHVSLTQRDQAVTDDEVAEAALEAAKAQVEREQKTVSEAKAAIKQAEAAVKEARIRLEYTRIKAPISGRIGKSNVTEGAIVAAYQTAPLATIQQIDPVYVDVTQSTKELLRLRQRLREGEINQEDVEQNKATIMLEDNTLYPQQGELKFRDVTVDPTTGSVILRIVVPNPDALLLPGMFVQAVITEGIKQEAILLPQNAVKRDPKGDPFILLVNGEREVEQRRVTIERSMGNQWLISSGLSSGERIILEGSQRVRSGDTVNPVTIEFEEETVDHTEKISQSSATE